MRKFSPKIIKAKSQLRLQKTASALGKPISKLSAQNSRATAFGRSNISTKGFSNVSNGANSRGNGKYTLMGDVMLSKTSTDFNRVSMMNFK